MNSGPALRNDELVNESPAEVVGRAYVKAEPLPAYTSDEIREIENSDISIRVHLKPGDRVICACGCGGVLAARGAAQGRTHIHGHKNPQGTAKSGSDLKSPAVKMSFYGDTLSRLSMDIGLKQGEIADISKRIAQDQTRLERLQLEIEAMRTTEGALKRMVHAG